MNRNYYIAGFTWDGDSQLDRFKEEHIWENGYDEKYEDVYDTMREGDYIALKSTYVKNSKSYLRIYCMGVIRKIYTDNMKVEVDWKECRKDLTDITWYANTLCKIDNEEHIKRIFNMDNYEETKQELIELLTANYNLILTGAPGTGKTYLAKQIAAQMDAQCDFVQFHPSYDYTDFVEGLRPTQDNNGNVGFKRKDGMFKDFCKKALQYTSIDGVFDALIQDINSGKITTIPLKTQESSRLVVEENKIRWHETNNPTEIAGHSVSKENIKKLYNKYSTLDSLNSIFNIDDEIRQVIGPCNSSYYYGILRYIIEKIGKKFVFIIDEINRGEISKIFGELFFSIDPGYRGKKGKMKTQYQNLIEEGDAFHDGFFVPENVYIIGTMNDIDRSVESMDFAMRRRFAFKEVLAAERFSMIEENSKLSNYAAMIKKRMENLNNYILTIQGLSTAYQIGASYFLKLENYLDNGQLINSSWKSLWDNHLKGLLFEYLRGLPNADTDLKKLEEAYNLKPKEANEEIISDDNNNE